MQYRSAVILSTRVTDDPAITGFLHYGNRGITQHSALGRRWEHKISKSVHVAL